MNRWIFLFITMLLAFGGFNSSRAAAELTPGILNAEWSPDAKVLAVCTTDGRLLLYHPKKAPTLVPQRNCSGALAFSHDGELLASAHQGIVYIWKLLDASQVAAWRGSTQGKSYAVDFSGDNSLVVISFENLPELYYSTPNTSGIYVWNYARGTIPKWFPFSPVVHLLDGVINADNSLIATSFNSSQNGSGVNISYLALYGESVAADSRALVQLRPQFMKLLFSPTNPLLLATLDELGVVRLWDLSKGIESLSLVQPQRNTSAITFSLDGKQIFTAGEDWKIRVWDVGSGTHISVQFTR